MINITTKSFWLDLNIEKLSKRLNTSKKRPLLVHKNIKLTLEKIYNERKNQKEQENPRRQRR